ncbi:restriction endonuclease subunit S [Lactiplantibacillus plantarum]|uniref:restriction endonuclease subunit S n=1 Tax=Lactiplantibacillus plantarum TaxID=1590 RepID=UPI000FF07C69|nr:restriction endonuclease subunit S [Lactiplantibacillus plantarum]
MKDNQAKYPQLRFKGFTDPWEERKLGEVVEMFNGDRGVNYPKNSELVAEGIPFINAGDLQDGQINLENCKRISREKFNQLGGAKIKRGDILYCLRGTIGKNALVDNFDEGTVASSLVDIRPKSIDGMYLFIILNSGIEYRQRELSDEGAAQPNLSVKNISKFTIPAPETEEQCRIAEFFKSINSLIALHQRKLAKLKELKQGYLQKMFPKNGAKVPELRFAGFADAWEERKLGDLGSVAMNKRIFKEQTSDVGDIPFYKIGTFGGTPDAFISRDIFEEYKSKYQYPEVGDILISASGSIGRTVVYQGYDEYFQDSNIVWLKHDQQLDNSFLKQFYSIVKWQGLEGSTIKRLYNKNILETKITLPSPEEQAQLGSFFKQLDDTIALHQRKLEKLQELKKGYLQKMFC